MATFRALSLLALAVALLTAPAAAQTCTRETEMAVCEQGSECTKGICVGKECRLMLKLDGSECTIAESGTAGTCTGGVCGAKCVCPSTPVSEINENTVCKKDEDCTGNVCNTGECDKATGLCLLQPKGSLNDEGIYLVDGDPILCNVDGVEGACMAGGVCQNWF